MLPNQPSMNRPMAGQAPAQPPMGQPGQGQPDQGQVVEAIKQVLQRVKTLADQNGIDLMAILAEMGQGKARASAPPPPTAPPEPPM